MYRDAPLDFVDELVKRGYGFSQHEAPSWYTPYEPDYDVYFAPYDQHYYEA